MVQCGMSEYTCLKPDHFASYDPSLSFKEKTDLERL